MFDQLRKDIQTVMERDPAAKSVWEVLLCYPGLRALQAHRRAHRAYLHGHTTYARWISQRAKRRTGIEIHPGAVIGEACFIDHGDGVVIGETTVIGDRVTLYQGVTLGGTGKETGKRHPTIGSGVTIGAGAKVLGPITIGDGSKIGAGSIVLKDVPPGCTVVGNPGRIVRKPIMPKKEDIDLDQVHLPDPMMSRMEALYQQMLHLQQCLVNQQKQGCTGHTHCMLESDMQHNEQTLREDDQLNQPQKEKTYADL